MSNKPAQQQGHDRYHLELSIAHLSLYMDSLVSEFAIPRRTMAAVLYPQGPMVVPCTHGY